MPIQANPQSTASLPVRISQLVARHLYLDHVPFWNSLDPQRKPIQYKDYYNEHRTHESLVGLTPDNYENQQPAVLRIWRISVGDLTAMDSSTLRFLHN